MEVVAFILVFAFLAIFGVMIINGIREHKPQK